MSVGNVSIAPQNPKCDLGHWREQVPKLAFKLD